MIATRPINAKTAHSFSVKALSTTMSNTIQDKIEERIKFGETSVNVNMQQYSSKPVYAEALTLVTADLVNLGYTVTYGGDSMIFTLEW